MTVCKMQRAVAIFTFAQIHLNTQTTLPNLTLKSHFPTIENSIFFMKSVQSYLFKKLGNWKNAIFLVSTWRAYADKCTCGTIAHRDRRLTFTLRPRVTAAFFLRNNDSRARSNRNNLDAGQGKRALMNFNYSAEENCINNKN